MSIFTAENIYNTLTGSLNEPYQVPSVENAFAEGEPCDKLYREIYRANLRLCERLGQVEEDPDVELIINNFLEINKYLCMKTKLAGKLEFGRKHSSGAIAPGNRSIRISCAEHHDSQFARTLAVFVFP